MNLLLLLLACQPGPLSRDSGAAASSMRGSTTEARGGPLADRVNPSGEFVHAWMEEGDTLYMTRDELEWGTVYQVQSYYFGLVDSAVSVDFLRIVNGLTGVDAYGTSLVSAGASSSFGVGSLPDFEEGGLAGDFARSAIFAAPSAETTFRLEEGSPLTLSWRIEPAEEEDSLPEGYAVDGSVRVTVSFEHQ